MIPPQNTVQTSILMPPMWKVPKFSAYTVRFILRFFLCEVLGSANISFAHTCFSMNETLSGVERRALTALAFGISFWVCGPISGPQLNACVTIFRLMTRRVAYPYCIVGILGQLVGSIIGCGIANIMGGHRTGRVHHYGVRVLGENSWGTAMSMECVATAMLATTILANFDEYRKDSPQNAHIKAFAFVLAMTMLDKTSLVGPFSGAGLNPTISFGAAIVNNYYDYQWVHVAGPVVGAILGTLLYEMVLSNGASLQRIKAWWTDPDFQRNTDYKMIWKRRRYSRYMSPVNEVLHQDMNNTKQSRASGES